MFVSSGSTGLPEPAKSVDLAESRGIEYSYPLINVISVGLYFIENVCFIRVGRATMTSEVS